MTNKGMQMFGLFCNFTTLASLGNAKRFIPVLIFLGVTSPVLSPIETACAGQSQIATLNSDNVNLSGKDFFRSFTSSETLVQHE